LRMQHPPPRASRSGKEAGTYTGIGHADQWVVIHRDGSFNFHQTIAFKGVVCGQSVELEFRNQGTGDFNTNVLTGSYSIVGPANVGRGNGTITGEPGVGGTYEGQVHCNYEPNWPLGSAPVPTDARSGSAGRRSPGPTRA
jgi:hypothetical protein